ncbi:MAG: helix-turn-helix domain-containing protein [Chloroflexota bacterium]|nr:helix-turn-helix domain-containing protein [Chloroflexota bacterium]
MDEEGKRREAIALLRRGIAIEQICTKLGRTRQWLGKWRRRFEAEGEASLRGRSRAPRHRPRATPGRIVRAVLTARDRLARRRGRQRFAGSGADAVAWELELEGVRPMPARRTIERILERAGRTARPRAAAHERSGGPYPYPRARAPGDLQQTDLVGPRHLRSRRGPVRFFDFHTVDVGGGGAATEQRPDKSAESFCGYLTGCAWPKLGLPRIWQVDNESALAGFPAAGRIFTQPVRLALLLGIEVRFIPMGEPGRNADVESFNALWQARVLRRFETPGLARLARVSGRFERWFMDERPHPKLSVAAHGTRFPGALLRSLDGERRTIPRGFSLDAYRDAAGELRLPLARGRISWVRRVAEDGELRILGHRLRLRRAANEYVIATLATGRGELTVQLDGRVIGSYRHAIDEKVVRPLVGRGR